MSTAVQTPPVRRPKPSGKARNGGRPDYNQIHRHLLPVEVHPLPVLIPHNPVSLVAIALSYLISIVSPPQRPRYTGYFSPKTSSIHVTDHASIRALWEMGFFGRGSLSRSEPTWLESQKRKGATAEENTSQRRLDRRQLKIERAKLEQEEIAKKLQEEQAEVAAKVAANLSLQTDVIKTNDAELNGIENVISSNPRSVQSEWQASTQKNGLPTPPPTSTSSEGEQPEIRPVKKLQRQKTVRFSPTAEAREFDLSSPVISPIKEPGSSHREEPRDQSSQDSLKQQEHLHLSLEEAFFLSYSLGVLDVQCEDSSTVLPSASLLSLFRRHSYFPARTLAVPPEPDDPFMLSYAVYHHYRSLGWVVRAGIKFSVDFLLYNRGPAFSHAEFAVVVLPSYSHPYWNGTAALQMHVAEKTEHTWWWLHSINRVQAQVHKQLVLCYVDVPPPLSWDGGSTEVDIARELSRYTIRDIGIKRWSPNRTRD